MTSACAFDARGAQERHEDQELAAEHLAYRQQENREGGERACGCIHEGVELEKEAEAHQQPDEWLDAIPSRLLCFFDVVGENGLHVRRFSCYVPTRRLTQLSMVEGRWNAPREVNLGHCAI